MKRRETKVAELNAERQVIQADLLALPAVMTGGVRHRDLVGRMAECNLRLQRLGAIPASVPVEAGRSAAAQEEAEEEARAAAGAARAYAAFLRLVDPSVN